MRAVEMIEGPVNSAYTAYPAVMMHSASLENLLRSSYLNVFTFEPAWLDAEYEGEHQPPSMHGAYVDAFRYVDLARDSVVIPNTDFRGPGELLPFLGDKIPRNEWPVVFVNQNVLTNQTGRYLHEYLVVEVQDDAIIVVALGGNGKLALQKVPPETFEKAYLDAAHAVHHDHTWQFFKALIHVMSIPDRDVSSSERNVRIIRELTSVLNSEGGGDHDIREWVRNFWWTDWELPIASERRYGLAALENLHRHIALHESSSQFLDLRLFHLFEEQFRNCARAVSLLQCEADTQPDVWRAAEGRMQLAKRLIFASEYEHVPKLIGRLHDLVDETLGEVRNGLSELLVKH